MKAKAKSGMTAEAQRAPLGQGGATRQEFYSY